MKNMQKGEKKRNHVFSSLVSWGCICLSFQAYGKLLDREVL
jgi:hypothetical protein